MAKNSDLAKLRHENEILRRELVNLRENKVKKDVVAMTSSVATKRKVAEAQHLISTDFKFLKNDLLRTGTLTALCLTIIIVLAAFGNKIPAINVFINSLKI